MRFRGRILKLVGLTLAVLFLSGAFATVGSASTYSTSKPVLSSRPMMSKPFKVSGTAKPTAKKGKKIVVKLEILMWDGEGYGRMGGLVTAKLAKRHAGGYTYSRSLTIPMTGKHAVRALQYRNGKLVSKSKITYMDLK
jgi:hypothetical protein